MIVYGNDIAKKAYENCADGEKNIFATYLCKFTDKSLAIKFFNWIENDFTTRNKDINFWIVMEDNSEFVKSPINLIYTIKLVCHDDNWSYLMARLRTAYKAVAACCQ